MTPEEMQKNSGKKVQQVLDLMKTLHITIEAKQKMDRVSGFIEPTIMWHDNENYPAPEPVAPTGPVSAETIAAEKAPDAPTGETAEAEPTHAESV